MEALIRDALKESAMLMERGISSEKALAEVEVSLRKGLTDAVKDGGFIMSDFKMIAMEDSKFGFQNAEGVTFFEGTIGELGREMFGDASHGLPSKYGIILRDITTITAENASILENEINVQMKTTTAWTEGVSRRLSVADGLKTETIVGENPGTKAGIPSSITPFSEEAANAEPTEAGKSLSKAVSVDGYGDAIKNWVKKNSVAGAKGLVKLPIKFGKWLIVDHPGLLISIILADKMYNILDEVIKDYQEKCNGCWLVDQTTGDKFKIKQLSCGDGYDKSTDLTAFSMPVTDVSTFVNNQRNFMGCPINQKPNIKYCIKPLDPAQAGTGKRYCGGISSGTVCNTDDDCAEIVDDPATKFPGNINAEGGAKPLLTSADETHPGFNNNCDNCFTCPSHLTSCGTLSSDGYCSTLCDPANFELLYGTLNHSYSIVCCQFTYWGAAIDALPPELNPLLFLGKGAALLMNILKWVLIAVAAIGIIFFFLKNLKKYNEAE